MKNNPTSIDAANLLVKLNAIEAFGKNARPEQLLVTRVLSAQSLAEVTQRKEDAAKILLPLTSETNIGLVQTSTYALGNLATTPETVVPRLCELLESNNGYVQLAAINALGNFGTNAVQAEPALRRIAKTTQDYFIGRAVKDTLGKISIVSKP
ncbi:MAG: HEAT repeat domain-containing protein [Verrucomicrobiota bacterium]